MSGAYYNENDPRAAAWLRELIKAGAIAPGFVDERSIEDVTPEDLAEFEQCHFFAGIGVWSHALRQAGISDQTAVWTGSCPCQPFSSAGKRGGTADERHLWPAFHWLIAQCRPQLVFGEQVASPDGRAWLDLVSTDLEGEGYACGSVSVPSCGFGAPHKRQRLYWVAKGAMGHHQSIKRERPRGTRDGGPRPADHGAASPVADDHSQSARGHGGSVPRAEAPSSGERQESGYQLDGSRDGGATRGYWAGADWIECRDGKTRPSEPGTFPLAHGTPERVGLLRGYGNALVSPQAQAFIESYFEGIAQ